MGEHRRFRRVLAVAAVVLVVWLLTRGGHGAGHHTTDTATAPPSTGPTGSPSPSVAPSGGSASGGSAAYDPPRFAAQVRTHAAEAGISPRLLMAILFNEAYKPHDPDLERAWQRLKPDSAFGIANMHRAAFDETKQAHDFAGRNWEELPDDPDLAIKAEAWYLHDLADQLPAHWSASLTKDELLALGYNTGPGNMLAFARGATPGSQAASYLDRLHENLPKADEALRQSG